MTPYLQQHNAVLQRLQALPVGSFSQFIAITVRITPPSPPHLPL